MRSKRVSNKLGLSVGSGLVFVGGCLLQVYPQSHVPHGHVSGDQGCLEHLLDGLRYRMGVFASLELLDVARGCRKC